MPSWRPLRWLLLCTLVFYALILQFYRLQLYLHSSTPISYAGALSYFPKHPASVWTKRIGYLQEPGSVIDSPICQRDGDEQGMFILVVVISKPDRFEARLAIRASWAGYFREHLPRNSGVVFALGVNSLRNDAEQRKLRSEIDHYDDLLIVDVLESYHNLSLKAVSTFRWIESKCPGAMLILKTDDDVVVFGPNVVRYLSQYYALDKTDQSMGPSLGAAGVIRQPDIHCYVYRWSKVVRDRKAIKHFVPFEHYPARYYQPFCSGHAYVLTRPALQLLMQHIQTLDFYSHLEDVLVTGVLAQKAGVKRISRNEFHGEHCGPIHADPTSKPEWKYAFANHFTVHYVRNPQEQMRLWRSFMIYRSGE